MNLQKKKVALITTTSYPEKVAGTEIYVHALASTLVETEYEPIVITHSTSNSDLSYSQISVDSDDMLIEVLKKQDIEIVHFHTINEGGFDLNTVSVVQDLGFKTVITFHLANNTCLTNDLWKNRQRICTGEMKPLDCTACYLQAKTGSLVISKSMAKIGRSIEESKILDRSKGLQKVNSYRSVKSHQELVRTVLSKSSALLCLADWYERLLLLNGVDDLMIRRIHQINPFDGFADPQQAILKRSNLKRVLFVGRICVEKGVETLIRSWSARKTSNLTLTFFGNISGDKAFCEKFERFIEGSDNVEYLGTIDNRELESRLVNYDVLILPSLFSEMSPLVIQEARSRGLYLIGSDSPGVEEACRYGYHIVFPRGRQNKLAGILEKLNSGMLKFSSPTLSLNHSTELAVGEQHVRIYDSLLGR